MKRRSPENGRKWRVLCLQMVNLLLSSLFGNHPSPQCRSVCSNVCLYVGAWESATDVQAQTSTCTTFQLFFLSSSAEKVVAPGASAKMGRRGGAGAGAGLLPDASTIQGSSVACRDRS